MKNKNFKESIRNFFNGFFNKDTIRRYFNTKKFKKTSYNKKTASLFTKKGMTQFLSVKGNKLRAAVAVIIVLIVLMVIVKPFKSHDSLRGYKLTVEAPKYGDIGKQIPLQGETVSKSILSIYGQSGFTLERVNVSKGDIVEQGEVIANYMDSDISDMKNEILVKNVDLKKLETTLEQLKEPLSTTKVDNERLTLAQLKNDNAVLLEKIPIYKRDYILQKKQFSNVQETFKAKDELYRKDLITRFDYNNAQQELNNAEMVYNTSYQKYTEATMQMKIAKDSITHQADVLKNAERTFKQAKKNQGYKQQQTEYDIQKLKIEISRLELTYVDASTGIKSPVNGVVQFAASSGTTLSDGQDTQIFQLLDTGTLQIEVLVPSRFIQSVKQGDKAVIKALDLNKTFEGKVEKIGSVASAKDGEKINGNFVSVILSVDNTKNILKPQYKVMVNLEVDAKNHVMIIPTTSIVKKGTETFVYILNSSNVLEKKDVKVGISNTSQSQVSGLKLSDEVVTNLTSLLKDGQRISPKEIEKVDTATDSSSADLDQNSTQISNNKASKSIKEKNTTAKKSAVQSSHKKTVKKAVSKKAVTKKSNDLALTSDTPSKVSGSSVSKESTKKSSKNGLKKPMKNDISSDNMN